MVAAGEGIVREFGMDMHTLLYLKRITNKALLHSTGNSAQCYVTAWMGEGLGGKCIRVYAWLSLSCGTWDLVPTRDGTQAPCISSMES